MANCNDCIHRKVCVILAFPEAFENTEWEKEPCDHFKDADVEPKSEEEELIYKLECLLCHATGGKLSKHTYDLRTMEAVVTDYIDEAYLEGVENGYKKCSAEIFEEIEFDIHQLMFERDETRAIAIEGVIANLKKKYTEGKE